MHALTATFVFLTPMLFGSWIGTLARRPISAFFLGWIFTPITAVVAALVVVATIRTPFAMFVAVESPVVGIGTGIISGGFAAFVVHRRLTYSENNSAAEQAADIVASDSQEN